MTAEFPYFVRRGIALYTAAFLAFAQLTPLSAQGTTGSVSGVAKSDDAGIPISFGLARLVAPDSPSTNLAQTITSATGRFYFASVPTGSYRLQFLRIGFRPVLSATFQVRAGETSEQELRASMVGMPLAAVRVYPKGACLTNDQVASDAYLAALWDDIRKGVEIRRAFQLRYRFKRELSAQSETFLSSRSTAQSQRTDTILSEPDSVLKYEARARPCRATSGYGKDNCFTLPTDYELIDGEFFRVHCIVAAVLDSSGLTGMQFRPNVKSKDSYDIQGTIWVDDDTRLMRRLEYEHLNGDKPISRITMTYADIPVADIKVRLFTASSSWIHPPKQPRGTITTRSSSIRYWDFEEVRPH